MQTDIKATNMELTDAIRAYVQGKMDDLDAITERFGTAVRADVEVGRTTQHHKTGEVFRAEVRVRLPGNPVYAEALHEDLYTAVNNAQKEAERQIIKNKGKHEPGRESGRKGGEAV